MDNAFSALGLPADIFIAEDKVLTAYYERQKLFHPDAQKEDLRNLEKSMAMNQALEDMKSPAGRANHYYRHRFGHAPPEAAVSRELLVEIMALREEIARKKDPQDLLKAVEADLRQTLGCFAQSHAAAEMQSLLVRIRYLEKILEDHRKALKF